MDSKLECVQEMTFIINNTQQWPEVLSRHVYTSSQEMSWNNVTHNQNQLAAFRALEIIAYSFFHAEQWKTRKQSWFLLKHRLTLHFSQITRDVPEHCGRLQRSLDEDHLGQCPTPSCWTSAVGIFTAALWGLAVGCVCRHPSSAVSLSKLHIQAFSVPCTTLLPPLL